MRIGARIRLNSGFDVVRDGLALLADSGWMMNLWPASRPHPEHPAGSSRPGMPVHPLVVAVTFGKPAVGDCDMVLPVRWESVEPGDEFTVLLDGDVTLAREDGQGHRTLTMAGFCRVPCGVATSGDFERARVELAEAARIFITSVATAAMPAPGPGQDRDVTGPAWSWVNGGLPRT